MRSSHTHSSLIFDFEHRKRRGKGAQSKTIRQTGLHDEYNSIPLDGVAVVNKALSISEPLVGFAPENIKSHVWLYRSGQNGHGHKIVALASSTLFQSTKSICARHSLKDDQGKPLIVNLSRLRRLWKVGFGSSAAATYWKCPP